MTATVKELDSVLATLNAAIGKKATSGEDITALVLDFATKSKERGELFQVENASIINDTKMKLAKDILTIVEKSGLGDILGVPIDRITWRAPYTPEGEEPVTSSVIVNPKTTGRQPKASTDGGNGTRARIHFKVASGDPLTARQFCDQFANDEERANSYYDKWPSALGEKTIMPRLITAGTKVEVIK